MNIRFWLSNATDGSPPEPVADPSTEELANAVETGDRGALARAITLVESTRADHQAEADRLIDADDVSVFNSGSTQLPHETIIDLGQTHMLEGFTYLPMQDRWFRGIVTHFEFLVSEDGLTWGTAVAQGEFSNIRNNPVRQRITFPASRGRFVKFRALQTMDDPQDSVTGAEIGVITVGGASGN